MHARPLLILVLALGRVSAASAGGVRPPQGQGEYIEEVVVNADRQRGVGYAVVRLQFRDKGGGFVHGLTAEDLVLNDGALRVDALVPVIRNPDIHFVVDLTTIEERPPFTALTTLSDVIAAFPEGRARVTLLRPGRSSSVAFHLAGEDAGWASCARLLEFMQSPQRPDLGLSRRTMKAWAPKHLQEQLADAARQFLPGRDRERFLVLLSDGYDGDPLGSYVPCCPPMCGPPCVLKPLPVRSERETAVSSALAHAGTHLVFRACSARLPYFGDLLDRFGLVWAFAPATDRKRLSHFATGLEGSGEWEPEADPAAQVAAIVSDVRQRLDGYLLAFSVADAGATASFVKVDLRKELRSSGVHAVPERIGEQLLLSDDPWLVAYSGDRRSMPWPLARELSPGSSGAIEEFATLVLERFEGDRAGWSRSCPFWLRGFSERDEPILRAALATRFDPSAIDEALQEWPQDRGDLNLCALLREISGPGSSSR